MNRICVVGMGPGSEEYVTPIARRKATEADVLVGSPRLTGLFPEKESQDLDLRGKVPASVEFILANRNARKIAVLVSGDPGLYSFLGVLARYLKPEEYEVIPGISSVQIAFARLGEGWEDALVFSIHGRGLEGLAEAVKGHAKVALLTDGRLSPGDIASHLLDGGVADREMVVCSDLSMPGETITRLDLEAARSLGAGTGLCTVIIRERPSFPRKRECRAGRADTSVGAAMGKLYGVGIGPGDPDLVTLRAKRVLESVGVVFVPRSSTGEDSLARSILEKSLDSPPEFAELDFPMLRDRAALRGHWERAAERVVERLRSGQDAAFATLGDPLLYSTFNYLLSVMSERYSQVVVETVPGLSSIGAAAALTNLPLVEGDERMAILPAPSEPEHLEHVLKEFETVVVMKLGSRLGMVLEVLRRLGLMDRAVLVSHAGLANESVVRDLSSITDERLGYLSIIMVTQGERRRV